MKQGQQKGTVWYAAVSLLIGFGFFTMGLMDPLYDTYVPLFLEDNGVRSNFWAGFIMTLDNLLAVFLIPVFSYLSDRTRTPFGRRMPYVVSLLPLSALSFALIPFLSLSGLVVLILGIFVLNLFKQAARGPVVALMPDVVPGQYRSLGNGVINFMGGIGAIVGTMVLSRWMDTKVRVMGELKDKIVSFPIAGGLVLLSTVLLLIFIRENKMKVVDSTESEEPKGVGMFQSLKLVLGAKEISSLLILLSLFCWFFAYQGILPFLGKFSVNVLNLSKGSAAIAAGMVAIAYTIFAIPGGIVAQKIGRKKAIRISLAIIVVVLCAIGFIAPGGVTASTQASPAVVYSIWAGLFVFGIFWVTVVTNSFPMLWQMAGYENMGTYTGAYYFFSQLAAITAPPITGFIADRGGYKSLFFVSALLMGLAFILMGKVKRGEAHRS